jgi:hypothetical protein
MSREYELETMQDMFKIPVSRFDDFMVDLKEWHKIGKQTTKMLNTIAVAVGEPKIDKGVKMHWIDDGKHNKKIIIHAVGYDRELTFSEQQDK